MEMKVKIKVVINYFSKKNLLTKDVFKQLYEISEEKEYARNGISSFMYSVEWGDYLSSGAMGIFEIVKPIFNQSEIDKFEIILINKNMVFYDKIIKL